MEMIKLKKSRNEKLDTNPTPPYNTSRLERMIIESKVLERIIKDNNLLPINFLEKGVKKAKSVAFILLPDGGATGFLIGKDILLTNNHVLENEEVAKNAKILFNYQINIDGTNAPVDEYICDPDQFFYTNKDLDYSIVKIKKSLNGESIDAKLTTTFESNSTPGEHWGVIPLIEKAEVIIGKRGNIIQHPAMRRKEIACHDNILEKIEGNFLLYTTDTEPGSSGSPVFNDKWELLALHHSSGEEQNGQWLNNEGIIISHIINDLIKTFNNDERGKEILFELGISGIEECTASGSVNVDRDGRVSGSGSITCRF